MTTNNITAAETRLAALLADADRLATALANAVAAQKAHGVGADDEDQDDQPTGTPTLAGRLREAERVLEDAQAVARAERKQLSEPRGAAAGVAEARRRAGKPVEPRPDVEVSPATAAAVTAAEKAVTQLRAESRREQEASWQSGIEAARVEARRRHPVKPGETATEDAASEPASTEATSGSTSAGGRAEAQRRIAARGRR
ncbi:hypothetical protein O2W15_02105 [Modestobacter sp. VKM Ac-2979]|uniref:hypothetical protein n=1 Tax=unclassified Modestobacter TaxID=2643866 RepID=UPI0022ABA360|nr:MULTISPECIES: hypothetical protein [unclassified Modestobacter]MCZ2810219.1 hypothetical protein [Modestobacter sp. VKM Ac-2979]MCZ2841705.1 hypothetical protein [Modestobacter sp. VKM Ac-2980]